MLACVKRSATAALDAEPLIDTPPPASTLTNRDAERWEPLFRIASLSSDPTLRDFVIGHAARQIETDHEESTPEADPSLLAALHRIVTTTPRITPGDVLVTAKDIDPDAFDEGWNARRVSVVLRRYGLRTTRSHGKRLYRIKSSDVATIAKRYGYEIDEQERRVSQSTVPQRVQTRGVPAFFARFPAAPRQVIQQRNRSLYRRPEEEAERSL